MEEIGIIYIIISILYIIERKPINILINYIGITIIIAISILNTPIMLSIGGEYISYIIIMVQVSAITIIFGFIIMLYPNTPASLARYNNGLLYNNNNNNNNYGWKVWGMVIIIILILLSLTPTFHSIWVGVQGPLGGSLRSTIGIMDWDTINNGKVLTKIGELLYISWEEDGYTNLSKLLIITLILLLAIIALFLANL